jgi:hypothetical protein
MLESANLEKAGFRIIGYPLWQQRPRRFAAPNREAPKLVTVSVSWDREYLEYLFCGSTLRIR